MRLDWKMPTWHELAGLVLVGQSLVTQLGNVGGETALEKTALATAGAVLLAAGRIAQAWDNSSSSSNPPPAPVVLPTPQITHALHDTPIAPVVTPAAPVVPQSGTGAPPSPISPA
jgi:hypothetical protein